jgi:UPF0716 protein FxsA
MAGVLLLLFVIVPIVELYVIIQVGSWLGAGPTIGLLLLSCVVGVVLVKHQGLSVWARFRAQIDRGALPTDELVDGFLLLVAGALMIVPGFVTDVVGLVLLVPPLRRVVRNLLIRRYRDRFQLAGVGYGGAGVSFHSRRVYDVENVGDITPPQWRERPATRGELEP